MMALLTFSCPSIQAKASWLRLRPASEASEPSLTTADKTSAFMSCCMNLLDSGSAAQVACSGASPGRYLPVSTLALRVQYSRAFHSAAYL
jgi:hypothetical protein